jgi:ABC-type tungstate transport system substrate-binding protein
MRSIAQYIIRHLRNNFNPLGYGLIALFLAVSLAFNYTFDFEDRYLDTLPDLQRVAAYFIWHSLAWFTPVVILQFVNSKNYLQNKGFIIRSMLGLALLSLDRALPFVSEFILANFHPHTHLYLIKLAHNLSGLLIMVMPLLLYYLIFQRHSGHYYGLRPGKASLKPYFIMLLIMQPLLLAAALLPSFQAQYPMYQTTPVALHWPVPQWVTVVLYELTYALNFVAVEFFYRGFLVLGMASCLGRNAVVCMAVLYCFLHFGKPLPEAISSIFGGFILGVIALETRSIWGGIIVHVGIAWSMELLGLIL